MKVEQPDGMGVVTYLQRVHKAIEFVFCAVERKEGFRFIGGFRFVATAPFRPDAETDVAVDFKAKI